MFCVLCSRPSCWPHRNPSEQPFSTSRRDEFGVQPATLFVDPLMTLRSSVFSVSSAVPELAFPLMFFWRCVTMCSWARVSVFTVRLRASMKNALCVLLLSLSASVVRAYHVHLQRCVTPQNDISNFSASCSCFTVFLFVHTESCSKHANVHIDADEGGGGGGGGDSFQTRQCHTRRWKLLCVAGPQQLYRYRCGIPYLVSNQCR